jgi:mannose-6-phosphate isomerase-like protein (cupin superfamily)
MNKLGNIDRIVVVDEGPHSKIIADGASPDVRTDPARPGFSVARMWVTDRTPIRLQSVRESLHLPHTYVPPRGGSTCYVVTFPPDASWRGEVGARQVGAYFDMMGAPEISTYSASAPHPYMRKARTLDFCLVIDGEITLVLDSEEVHLKTGDTVVQRGTNHAWSNRSDRPCVIAFSSHDAAS